MHAFYIDIMRDCLRNWDIDAVKCASKMFHGYYRYGIIEVSA